MGFPPVVVVESGGVPRTQVDEGVPAPAFTVVDSGARPITLADNAPPIALFNEDGTRYEGGRLPGSNLAYALGDSRTASMRAGIGGLSFGFRGMGATVARGLLRQRMDLPHGNINGGSGESLGTLRSTRYSAAKASDAKTLFLLGGVNQGASLAQDIEDITYMVMDFAASAPDRVVVVLDELAPSSALESWDQAARDRHVALRDAIRLLSNPRAGIYVAPSWRVSTGGTDADVGLTGMYEDGVHTNTPGSFALGKMLAEFTGHLFPPLDPYFGKTFAIGVGRDGANFAGSTGDSLSSAGLTSVNTASTRLVVDPTEGLTWAEATLNTTANASILRATADMPANITPGVTTVSGIAIVKLHAGLANCRALYLFPQRQSGGPLNASSVTDWVHPGTSTEIGELPNDEDMIAILRTPPFVVDAAATQARLQVIAQPEIVGGVTQTMTGLVSVARLGLIIE